MQLRIRDFLIGGPERRVGSIKPDLLDLPEIKNFLAKNGLTAELVQTSDFLGRRLDEESRFEDISFKQLLNGIAKVKRGGWIVRHAKHKGDSGKDWIDIVI